MNTPEVTTGRPSEVEVVISKIKGLRRDGNALIARLEEPNALMSCAGSCAELDTAIERFKEGVMWLGQTLHAIDKAYPGASPTPYPHSCEPSSPVIEPQADSASDASVDELFQSLLIEAKTSPDRQFPG